MQVIAAQGRHQMAICIGFGLPHLPHRKCCRHPCSQPRSRWRGNSWLCLGVRENSKDSVVPEQLATNPLRHLQSKEPEGLLSQAMQPELLAIALGYFVQGITELATLAQTYHLKDELHADPAQVALFLSMAGIPWTIKPLIGYISDTVPLWGYRRRSYLMLASAAGSAAYLWMARGPASGVGFLGGIMMASTASAVSDVVVDSMVVERARGESQATAGSLQSLCWASYALAQVVTASMSGALVQEYGPRVVFQLTAMFPLLVGATSLVLPEERSSAGGSTTPRSNSSSAYTSSTDSDALSETHTSNSPPTSWGGSSGSSGIHMGDTDAGAAADHEVNSAGATSNGAVGVLRADSSGAYSYPSWQKGSHSSSSRDSSFGSESFGSMSPDVGNDSGSNSSSARDKPATTSGASGSSALSLAVDTPSFSSPSSKPSAKAYTSLLWSSLKRPDVASPLAFVLLLSATPSADSAMFFYQTEQLHFSASFLGQVQLAAACASFAGVLLYNSALKRVPVRSLMLWGSLLAAGLQCSQLALVSGWHRQFGLDDHLFVLGGSVVLDVVQNVLSMPIMVLVARLCPPGIEATMFATIMSLINVADGVRMGGGAALMHTLHVSADDWTNLPLLLGICNACLLLPLPLIPLIPDQFNVDKENHAAPGAPPASTAVTAAAGTLAAAAQVAPEQQLPAPADHAEIWQLANPQSMWNAPIPPLAVAGSRGIHHHYHTPHLQPAFANNVVSRGIPRTPSPPAQPTDPAQVSAVRGMSAQPVPVSAGATAAAQPAAVPSQVATSPVNGPVHHLVLARHDQAVTGMIIPLPSGLSMVPTGRVGRGHRAGGAAMATSGVEGVHRRQRQRRSERRAEMRRQGLRLHLEGGLYANSAYLEDACWSDGGAGGNQAEGEVVVKGDTGRVASDRVVVATRSP